MPSVFPGNLDSFYDPQDDDLFYEPGQPNDATEVVALANDALEKTQAKVGVNGSAVTTSLDYRIAQLEGATVVHAPSAFSAIVALSGSNAVAYDRNGAAIGVPKSNHRTKIQDVIDVVQAAGGGVVFVTAGVYDFAGSDGSNAQTLRIPSGVHLMGEGVYGPTGQQAGTIFRASGAWGAATKMVLMSGASAAGATLSSICIDGDDLAPYGLRMENGKDLHAYEFSVKDCTTVGVWGGGEFAIRMRHGAVHGCPTGIETSGSDGHIEGMRVTGWSASGSNAGIKVSSGWECIECIVENTGSATAGHIGIECTGSFVRISNNLVRACGGTGIIASGAGTVCSGNTVIASSQSNAACIEATGSSAVNVIGNRVDGGGGKRWGVRVGGSGSRNGSVTGNTGTNFRAVSPNGILGTSGDVVVDDQTRDGSAANPNWAAYGNTNG